MAFPGKRRLPMFVLWALPAAVILAGGTYFIFLK
jgi:hypothetical protein